MSVSLPSGVSIKDGSLVIERGIKNRSGVDYDIYITFKSKDMTPANLCPRMDKEIAKFATQILASLPDDVYTDNLEHLGFLVDNVGSSGAANTAILVGDAIKPVLDSWKRGESDWKMKGGAQFKVIDPSIYLISQDVKVDGEDVPENVHEALITLSTIIRSNKIQALKTSPKVNQDEDEEDAGAVSKVNQDEEEEINPPKVDQDEAAVFFDPHSSPDLTTSTTHVPPSTSKGKEKELEKPKKKKYPLLTVPPCYHNPQKKAERKGILKDVWDQFLLSHPGLKEVTLKELLYPEMLSSQRREYLAKILKPYFNDLCLAFTKIGEEMCSSSSSEVTSSPKKTFNDNFLRTLKEKWPQFK